MAEQTQTQEQPKMYQRIAKYLHNVEQAIFAGWDNPDSFVDKYLQAGIDHQGGGNKEALYDIVSDMVDTMKLWFRNLLDKYKDRPKGELMDFISSNTEEAQTQRKQYNGLKDKFFGVLRNTQRMAESGRDAGYQPTEEDTGIIYANHGQTKTLEALAKLKRPDAEATENRLEQTAQAA